MSGEWISTLRFWRKRKLIWDLGIGPCYSDKVVRFGIRVCDLLDVKVLNDKLLTLSLIAMLIVALVAFKTENGNLSTSINSFRF